MMKVDDRKAQTDDNKNATYFVSLLMRSFSNETKFKLHIVFLCLAKGLTSSFLRKIYLTLRKRNPKYKKRTARGHAEYRTLSLVG